MLIKTAVGKLCKKNESRVSVSSRTMNPAWRRCCVESYFMAQPSQALCERCTHVLPIPCLGLWPSSSLCSSLTLTLLMLQHGRQAIRLGTVSPAAAPGNHWGWASHFQIRASCSAEHHVHPSLWRMLSFVWCFPSMAFGHMASFSVLGGAFCCR